MSKIDVDMAVAQAKAKPNDGKLSIVEAPKNTRMSHLDLPVRPMFWQIIIQPIEPPTQIGSILIDEKSQEVEQIQTTIGHVLAIGSLAFKGKTAGGVALNEEELIIQVGDCVLFSRYSGQKIKVKNRKGDEKLIIMLNDSDLMGVVSNPERIRFWL